MRRTVRMRFGWTRAAWIAPALLATVLLSWGCGRKAAPEGAVPSTQVLVNSTDVARVETRRLESGVSFTGELAPAEIVQVNARFEGDLESVKVREGEAVRKGQSLAVYKPTDVRDRLQSAEADLLSAKAALLSAQNAERRAHRLFDAGAAASSDLEAAEAQRAAAEAGVSAAQARVNSAQEDSDKLNVPSPIAGSVSKTFVHGGDHTAVGDPIAQVVNTNELELSATVPAEAVSRVRPGTTIRFSVDAYPNEAFEGVIDRINPTTEPGTRQVRIYARIANADGRLVGGLFASGRAVDSAKEGAMVAPVAALRTEGPEKVVYRLRGGKAQRVPVQTGIYDEQSRIIELIGSVANGDSLLTGVLPGLRDGASVRVLSGDNASATPTAEGK